MRRIQFFSIHDGASGHYLRELDHRFSELDLKKELDINDVLELYNAKLYIDNELYLTVWDEKKRNELKDKTAHNWQKIKEFFLQIDSKSISILFGEIDFKYRKDFWQIIDHLNVYQKIKDESVEAILNSHPNEITNILKQQRLVTKYSNILRNYLLSHSKTAELILSEEDRSERKSKLHFPKSLSNIDKEKIIVDYLNQGSPNLNYVSLILYAKDSPSLKISDKTRLRAKQTYDRLSEEFLTSDLSATQVYGIEVGTTDKQNEFVIKKWEENTYKVTYNIDAFMALLRKEDLSLLFHQLFEFLDQEGLINLVNKESETNTIEKIFMQSKNEYGTGMEFSRKNMLSLAQIGLVNSLLKSESKNISASIDLHIARLATYDTKLENLRFTMPTSGLSYEDSIRILGPSLESLLNQYSLYINDGEIDFELLEISSKPATFGSINSKVQTKYIYPDRDSKINTLLNILFSDQGILHYVTPYEDKYDCFYDLLINETNLRYSSFEDYQRDTLDYLIAEDILLLENVEFLKIKNENQLFVIAKLYENGVLNYWHYPPTFRNELDELIKQGLCYSENKLFTKDEVTYLNYYLNKKEYTDGPDLRNKYMHGSNISSNSNKETDYFMYLRVVILCLLKIEDDLLLTEESKS